MSFNPEDFKANNVTLSTVTIDNQKVEWDTLSNSNLLIAACGKRSVVLNVVEGVAEVVVNVTSDANTSFTNFSDPERKMAGSLVKVIDNNITLPFLEEAVFVEVEQEPVNVDDISVDVEQEPVNEDDVLVSESVSVNLNYYVERECKHCGAPMGIYTISPEEYCEARPSDKRIDFTNHTPEETGVDSDDVDGVVMEYHVCSGCRSYEY